METSISKFERGHRPGSASGVCLLGDSCKSFTRETNKLTTLYLPSGPNSVNITAYYYNCEGILKKCSFGYKWLYMKRMGKAKKYTEATKFPCYRRILLKEAICYIIGIAAWKKASIPLSRHDEIKLANLSTILSTNKSKSVEDCLVLWMCITGEMRNHQAVCCHRDKNRSHRMELYALFSRYGIAKKDGFLYLPLDNAVLKIFCDKQIVICNFSMTPHVPDSTRNTNNFSKVHGPCP